MSSTRLLQIICVTAFIVSHANSSQQLCKPAEDCIALLNDGKPCPLFPNPNRPGPLDPQGFNLTMIRQDVFSYSDGIYFSLIIYRNGKLALIDFPDFFSSIAPDGTYRLLSAIQSVLAQSTPRVIYMIYSHFHVDHIGRAATVKAFFQQSYKDATIRIVGTTETSNFLQRNRDDIPLPQIFVSRRKPCIISFSPTLRLKLLVLGGHVKSDLLGYIPPSSDGAGIINLVDIINPKEAPLPQFTIAMNFEKFIIAQQQLLKLDFDIINPGHGFIGSRRDVENNLEYAKFVLQASREAAQEADTSVQVDTIQKFFNPNAFEFFNNPWAFGTIQGAQADICFRKVIRKWGCTLIGVDVVAREHCFIVSLYDFSSTFRISNSER